MRFQQISTLTQQYRSDSVWQNLNSSVTVSSMNAVKLQASNAPCYLNYRTRNRGKGWLDFVKSTNSTGFAGWKGFPVTGLEVQMFSSAGTRIFEEYIVMYRSKVAGEWLSWVSNAGLDMMEQLQNEQNLGGTLDASSIYSGWESKGDIQALDIRIYKDNGTPDSEITPPAVDFYQQYRTNSTWLNLTQSVTVTNMNGLKIQTRNKPFYIRYRTRNRGKGWLGYVVSTNNMDYAGWKGFAVTGLDLQVFSNSGTRIYDTHAVMYRSKVAGEWLSWVSNVSLELMEKLQTENNLGGTLDGTSVYSGWESKGDIQAVDIRIFENIGTVSGEVPPVLTADFSQQYRSNSTWLELTPSVLVTSMNSIKLQTKNKPYYLRYRTNNRGKGWLGYVLSNSIDDFAGWKGFPLTGVEIQMFKTDGTQIYDQHAVMYRSKVAGEWLSWVSNVSLELMTKIAREYSLSGALDANSTYSGWASKGDIQAIEIRVFDNVGTSTEDVPTPPSVDVVIPNEPNNPNGFRIFIDAGHGGIDPGACNGSYYEKNYTLKLSLLQKQYFEQAGYRVTMSRETDVTMENNSKANLANKVNADLYIANHINAFTTSGSNGVEVYYQANPSFTAASKAVAQKAVANLSSIFSSRGIKTKTQDDGKDWFCVLREPRMPSILIEHGFISNASDLAKLNDDANLDAMAKSVVKAVCDTMPNPPIEVYPPEIEPPVAIDLADLDESILFGKYNYFTQYNGNLDRGDTKMDTGIDDLTILKCLQLIYLFYHMKKDGEKKDRLYQEIKKIRCFSSSKDKYVGYMNAQGIYEDNYVEYNNRKTTQIIFSESYLVTKESIIRAHQTDTILTALMSLIPIYGFAMSELSNLLINIEQSGSTDILGLGVSAANNEVINYVMNSNSAGSTQICLVTLLLALPRIFDVVGENRESYVKYGVRLYEGDSFINVRIKYDLGIETMDFGIYFRQGTPICVMKYGPYRKDQREAHFQPNWDDLKKEWRDDGYLPSEFSDK